MSSRQSIAGRWGERFIPCPQEGDRYFYFLCKRSLDVIITLILLLFLLPLMLGIAVLIKLETPGPVLFIQERVGVRRRVRNGRVQWEVVTFPFYKFRSMVHGADQSLHRAHVAAFVNGQIGDENGSLVKLTNDPRVTRVGRVLRKTSLDELPQLFNVLKGDMSLVGPRPVPTYEAERYEPRHWQRLQAVPGITGWWQVYGRGHVPFETMVRMDVEYIRSQSLWLDLKLLILTLPVILSQRGAN
jgi:lipopolysaccharide/colanic/teichoic acid biosynthesis glycosyltransferase